MAERKIIRKEKAGLKISKIISLITLGAVYSIGIFFIPRVLGVRILPFKLLCWFLALVVTFWFGKKFFFLLKADEVAFITNNLSGKIFLKDKPGWKILIPVLERLDKISLKLKGPGEENPVFVSVPTLRSEVKIIAIYSYRVSRATPEVTFNYILAGDRVEEEMKSVLGGYFSILVSRLKIEEVITQYKPQLIKLVEALMTEGRLDSVSLQAEFLLEEAVRIAGEASLLERRREKQTILEDLYEIEKRNLEKRIADIHSLFDVLLKDFTRYLEGGLVSVEELLEKKSKKRKKLFKFREGSKSKKDKVKDKKSNGELELIREVKEKIEFLQTTHKSIERKEEEISEEYKKYKREEKGLKDLENLLGELGKTKFFSRNFIRERNLSPYERERGIDLNFYIKDMRPSDEIETARDDQARVEYQLEREARRRTFLLETVKSLKEQGIPAQAASDMVLIQLGAQEGRVNRIYLPDLEGLGEVGKFFKAAGALTALIEKKGENK